MEKRKDKKNMVQYRQTAFILAGVLILLSPFSFTAYAEPPVKNECISYAYTESNNHLFLLGTNKSVFGNNMTIQHNCDFIEIFVNGNFTAYTQENILTIPVNMGLNTIEIYSDNHSNVFENVMIMPDRLSWEFDWQEWQLGETYSPEKFIEVSVATAQANWASILSIVMVFTLVTMVYWHLINSYIDKNYCEEVRG